MFRNFKVVPYIIFGRGCFNQLDDILAEKREGSESFMTFLVDDAFSNSTLKERIPLHTQRPASVCQCRR